MNKKIEKIVYGKRNPIYIYMRKISHIIFKVIQKIHRKLFYEKVNNLVILVYPVIQDVEVLYDVVNRICWTYPNKSGTQIYLPTTISEEKIQNYCSLFQCNYFDNNIRFILPNKYKEYLNLSTKILVYNHKKKYSLLFNKNFYKIQIVDHYYYSLEEVNNMKFGLYNILPLNQKDDFHKLSKDNFHNFMNLCKEKTSSYIFVTGPSFSQYKEIDYQPNSLKIICNTIVKDDEFLDYIGGPDLICFADPAFHFSSNLYASSFRDLVMKTVKKYNSYILIPQSTVPLMVYHYPEIKDKVIGLSFSDKIFLPTINNLSAKPTGSIITFMMIPMASSLTNVVYIIGADGRGKNENYFWKHNDKVQLSSLMETIYITHPSFFRDRIYLNHYKEHCRYFEKILEYGERKGIRYISLTNSFIPALIKRKKR